MSNSFIKKGKKSRNELFLPSLRYVVADDWIDKLGHDAFIAWIKLHTWVDRSDENRDHDRIPYSLESTWKKLGVGKTKFYQKIIRPLWEYGLIDIIEYEESQRKSQKPKNIVVYESPYNKHETEVKPLEKLRDYNKDYDSVSQVFGRKGGQPAHKVNGSQTRTVENDGSQTRTVDGSQTRTVTVHKNEPSNVSNNLLINTNKSSNVSNNHHLSELAEETKQPAPKPKHDDDDQYKQLRDLFLQAKADDIKAHSKHYPKFKAAINAIGFDKLIFAASQYIEQEKEAAQIAWFIAGGYNNYLDKPKAKKHNQQLNSQLPEAVAEQAATVEDVEETNDDWKEKQKKLNDKLAAWEEKKQARMGMFRFPFNSN